MNAAVGWNGGLRVNACGRSSLNEVSHEESMVIFRLWGLLVYCVLCLNTPDDKQYDLFSVVMLGLGGVEFLVLCLKILRVLEVIIS